VKKFPTFYTTEFSLPCSHVLASAFYPEPDTSPPDIQFYLFTNHFNIILPLVPKIY